MTKTFVTRLITIAVLTVLWVIMIHMAHGATGTIIVHNDDGTVDWVYTFEYTPFTEPCVTPKVMEPVEILPKTLPKGENKLSVKRTHR